MTDSGVCLTQKREAKMCLIKPLLDLRNGTLSVTATGKQIMPIVSSGTEVKLHFG